jgi:small-conductance mechanosensitive channel
MANTSAKSRLRANTARLKLLRQVILGTNAIFAVVRGGVFYSSFSFATGAVWALFCLLYTASYAWLAIAARPTYSQRNLVDGGDDISAPGLNEYAHDAVYVTALAHLGFIFSRYSTLLLIAMPLYAIYAVCCGGPRSPPPMDTDDTSELAGLSRKQRRQAERGGSRKQS